MIPDGSISSIVGSTTGGRLIGSANQLYFARSREEASAEPLSCQANPLNLAHYVRAVPCGTPRIVSQGPVISTVEFDLTAPGYSGVAAVMRISLAAGERQARIRLAMSFSGPTVVCPQGAPGPHEGTYFPGIFVRFPMPLGAKPLADMAYCTTDGVLTSTNHETFMKEPFRNCTFNTLSLAGPNTGEYSVLTRGLPDFFAIKQPSPYLGMSLGVGAANCPYNGSYVHEYAVYAPPKPERGNIRISAYKAAQAFLVEPVAVRTEKSDGHLPAEASFVGLSEDDTIIPGVELAGGEYRVRVLNLSRKHVTARVTGLLDTRGAGVMPDRNLTGGSLRLGPHALRELQGVLGGR